MRGSNFTDTTVPTHREPPLRLLLSGAELWVTNVLVFALWYWRLDGGGPKARAARHEFGGRSFVFPQMQIEKAERPRFQAEHWHPRFVDYLCFAFHAELNVWSYRRAIARG